MKIPQISPSTIISKLLVVLVILLCFSCKSDDDGGDDLIIDKRYKVVFDSNGSGTIIGDESNNVLQKFRVNSTQIGFINAYYQINESSQLQLLGTDNSFNFKLYNVDVRPALENNTANVEATEEILNEIDPGTNPVVISGFLGESRFFVLSKEDNVGLVYREYQDTQLIDTRNLTVLFNIGAAFNEGYAFFPAQRKLLILTDDNGTSDSTINRIDISNWTVDRFPGAFQNRLSGYFSNTNQAFIIGRNSATPPVEFLYRSNGELVAELSETISRNVAVGFNTQSNNFEFVSRNDLIRGTGILNIQTGELISEGISGESFFVRSPLFFFNAN